MSGMLVAHLASKQIREGIEENRAIACYIAWLRKWQRSDIERLGALYFGQRKIFQPPRRTALSH